MRKAIIATAALFLVLTFSFAQDTQETKYTSESVAYISHITGKTFVQRASDLGFEEGALNMPISEGDRIGTADGRAEIHFGKGNFVRLDDNSKLDILNFPKKGDDITRFRIWSGNVFLTVGSLSHEKSIEIHTADASFYVLDRGIFRIDVRENRDTEIFVYKGLIEAAGEEGSTLIKGEQRLQVSEGRFTSKPATFMAVADDSFDRWNESRTRKTEALAEDEYMPEDLKEYGPELDEYGHWSYLSPYGYVWVPEGLNDDWRPYYNGRWVWLPISGWTWHPYDPWGWVTFHYGRWHWGVGLGWYWIPMSGWGPGWVNWWWGYDYYGWAPMSWWGYPGVLIGGSYYGNYYGGYYPPHSRALTVVNKNQLRAPNVSSVALRGNSLNSLSKMTLNSSTLPVRPTGGKVSVQPMGGKQVLLRKELGSGSLERDTRSRSVSPGKTKAPSSISSSGSKTATKSGGPAAKAGSSSGKANPPKSSASSGSKSSGGKVKKKDGESSAGLNVAPAGGYPSSAAIGGTSKSVGPRAVVGYPSSPSISRAKISGDRGASRSGSFLGRITRSLGGGKSSRVATSRSGSSSGVSSRGSSSKGSSGASRAGSSAGRSSSGSRSGSVRKK